MPDEHHQPIENTDYHMPDQRVDHAHRNQHPVRRKVVALALAVTSFAGGAYANETFGSDPSSEVQPPAPNDEVLSDKEDGAFDIGAAYRASEAKLDTAAKPLVMSPLSKKDEERMASIEDKINAKELNKGSWFESLEEAEKFYKGVLSPKEIKFYYEKWPLSYDRSMVELNNIESTLEANKARFIGVVKTSSGIGYNIYEASTDDKHDPPEIDAKALDVVTSLLISELSSLDQSVLPQAEIERLQKLAQAGKLNTVSVSMIIADDIDACVIPEEGTNILRQAMPEEKCDAIGLHIDSSELQNSDTTPYRNELILIGRSSGHGPVMSYENSIVAHELIHALMAMSTLTSAQRIAGSPDDDVWQREHNEIVSPLIARLERIAKDQGGIEKELEIIIGENPISKQNSQEIDFSNAEIRTPKEIADNIELDKGRGLKFASITIVERSSSGGEQLNAIQKYDYPIVEGYKGDGFGPLVNPDADIKFFSATPGPGGKPVVKEIEFNPKTMEVTPIQIGGKGAEVTVFTGELESYEDSNEYLLRHTDELAAYGVTPVAAVYSALLELKDNKGGGE